jgi:hypothetical protein
MLSLGPYIKSENNVIITPNALFLFFYQWMPFFSRLLFPHRFIFLLIICIVIIYGHGLLILKEKLKNIKILYYCICFMLIFIFLTDIYIKGYLPFPMSKIEVPEFYYEISKQNDYEIIDVPFTQSPWASFYQIFHHKKLLGGMPEMAGYLYPKEYFQFVISNSFLQFLISLNNYPPIYKPFVEIDLEEIKNLRFKYLILHQSSFYPSEYYRSFTSNPEDHYEQYKKIIESFFGNPVFSDKLINVYRIF